MSSVRDFHNQAMDSAFYADRERRRGNSVRAADLFEQALEFELKAISEMPAESGMGWDGTRYTGARVGLPWAAISLD